jgi:hypothetical protein
MHNLLLAGLWFSTWIAGPSGSRLGPMMEVHPAEYAFGREMTFTATVFSPEGVSEARLFLKEESSQPVSYPAEIAAGDGYLLSVRRDLESEPVFPFSKLTFWWEVDCPCGLELKSDPQTIEYADDRYAWRRLDRGRAAIAWVEGDSAAAEDAAELILLMMGTVSADLEAPIPERVALYIYPGLAELHSAVGPRIRGWEGAVSDPAAGIILMAASSDAGGRRPLAVLLPHEVAHVVMGAKWGSAYALLPLWLAEGTAAGYEMEPRPEADQALQDAARGGGLIPMRTLCGVFPAEDDPALLAYAESKSFVGFLKETYGFAGIRRAMDEYAAGADCEQGLKSSVGKTLSELESAWVDELTGRKSWLASVWAPVLAGAVLLAGVLVVRRLMPHGVFRPSKGKERTD